MNSKNGITLLGAYGFTALKIARMLNEQGIAFIIAGRDRAKLEDLKNELSSVRDILVVDIESDDDLEKMMARTGILISCIGPYNIFAPPVIEKAIQHGIIYMDITGEQGIVHKSFHRYRRKAEETGACIIHSLSFESALVDLLAAALIDRKTKWEELSSAYYFEKSIPSGGTRLSMQTSRFFSNYCIRDGALAETALSSFSKNVEYPEREELNSAIFMPYPEVLFFHERYSPRQSASYLLSSEINAKYLMAGSLPGPPLESIMEREKRKKKSAPTDEACMQQYFEVILYTKDVHGKEISHQLVGRNMYGITAGIVLNFLGEILKSGPPSRGVLAPSEAIEHPGKMLKAILDQNGIKLTPNIPFRIVN